MSKFKRIGVAVLATIALAGGAAAATASPAEAAIKGKGTVSARESDKVLRAMTKQRCLTIKETQRIVKGKGTKVSATAKNRHVVWSWNGIGAVDKLEIQYHKGCAYAHIEWPS
ncbi:MAG TPA: hypothetical protein VIT42_18290 [Microlunatus sp.]